MKVSSITFGARVKVNINKKLVNDLKESTVISPYLSAASSTVGSAAGVAVGNSAATVSDIVGSAFSLQASNINSSGIVPSVIKSAEPVVTPATVASSYNHPSAVGSFFSSVGSFLKSTFKIRPKVKDPS